MKFFWLFATIPAALLLGGCGTAGGNSSRPQVDRSTLTAENLSRFPGRNLFDVIRHERAHWLPTRGVSSLSSGGGAGVVVYRDGIRLGGASYLTDIATEMIVSVRYLSGPEASSRYGLNHEHGAILVVTKR